MRVRLLPLLSLLLILPVPSLRILAGVVWWPGTALGQGLFLAAKAWVLLLPLAWLLAVDRERPSWSPPRRGGLGLGALLGAATAAVIVLAWWSLGDLVDAAVLRDVAATHGLDRLPVYLAGALYWCLGNALLEEYLWRWFVTRQAGRLLGGRGPAAIAVSALGFTAHHLLVTLVYLPWPLALVAATGVCIGGATWSWLYLRYGSIWPGYLAHLGADLAIWSIGYALIFG